MSDRKFTDEDLAAAEQFCAMTMPDIWYDDAHGDGESPRCCAMVQKVTAFRAEAREQRDKEWAKALVPEVDPYLRNRMANPELAEAYIKEVEAIAEGEGFAAAIEKAARVVRKAPRTGESNARMRILEDAIRALTPEEPKP